MKSSEADLISDAGFDLSTLLLLLLLPGHAAKEQKFIVLTSSRCTIHGCGRGIETSSKGRLTLSRSSSSSATFHTMSL